MTHDEALKLAADRIEQMRPLVNDDVDAICGALVETADAYEELSIKYHAAIAERDALKGHAEVGALVVSLSRRVMTWLNSDDEKATKGEAWELGETVIASRLYDILYNAGAAVQP